MSTGRSLTKNSESTMEARGIKSAFGLTENARQMHNKQFHQLAMPGLHHHTHISLSFWRRFSLNAKQLQSVIMIYDYRAHTHTHAAAEHCKFCIVADLAAAWISHKYSSLLFGWRSLINIKSGLGIFGGFMTRKESSLLLASHVSRFFWSCPALSGILYKLRRKQKRHFLCKKINGRHNRKFVSL